MQNGLQTDSLKSVSSPARLHIGCGRRQLSGWDNFDLPGKPADIHGDARALPISDYSYDTVMAIHVFEHFYRHEAQDVLREWRRVLKPGGTLILEIPCLDKVLLWFTQDPIPVNMTLWALYGDPRTHKDGEPALHKWCYSAQEMADMCNLAGFSSVAFKDPEYHQPQRDIRIEAVR